MDLTNFDIGKSPNMASMFHGCSGLQSIDLSNWDIQSATYQVWVLDDDTLDSLRTIKTPKNFYAMALPVRPVQEDGEWKIYPTKWRDGNGAIYEGAFPAYYSPYDRTLITQSVTLTYIGVSTQSYDAPEDYNGPSTGGSGIGGNSSHSLPNTSAADHRELFAVLFLLSIICSVTAYGFRRKYR